MSGSPSRPPGRGALLLVIGLGGVLGALGRWGVDVAWGERAPGAWPWATFVVNVIGCLAIGVLAARLPSDHGPWWPRPFLITGILGGFTTFSAYALETGALLTEGATIAAIAYLAGTVVVGLLAVRIGVLIARGGAA